MTWPPNNARPVRDPCELHRYTCGMHPGGGGSAQPAQRLAHTHARLCARVCMRAIGVRSCLRPHTRGRERCQRSEQPTWRLAGSPTSRSPFSVNATTEGVVRAPSAFSITRAVCRQQYMTGGGAGWKDVVTGGTPDPHEEAIGIYVPPCKLHANSMHAA